MFLGVVKQKTPKNMGQKFSVAHKAPPKYLLSGPFREKACQPPAFQGKASLGASVQKAAPNGEPPGRYQFKPQRDTTSLTPGGL